MKKTRKLKDPGSAITHFIAMVLAMLGAAPLLIKAARVPDVLHVIALAIFILSMISVSYTHLRAHETGA